MNDSVTEVEAERRAGCAEDVIRRAQVDHARQHRRPAALTAREALAALHLEALIVWVAANNISNGVQLSDDDRARLNLAAKRIDTIALEVS